MGGSLKSFAKLAKLTVAHFNGCVRLGGPLNALARCKPLASLGLDGCAEVTGDVAVLGTLRALAFVALQGCASLSGDLRCARLQQGPSIMYWGGGAAARERVKEKRETLRQAFLKRKEKKNASGLL